MESPHNLYLRRMVKRRETKESKLDAFEKTAADFDTENLGSSSPPSKRAPKRKAKTSSGTATKSAAKTKSRSRSKPKQVEDTIDAAARVSPIFKELAEPRLPELAGENRARLLMQSPTRLYFYWALSAKPYHALHKAIGNGTDSYTLALRLTDLERESEEIHAVESEGSWWFDVRPDREYRAEIGFFAPNRPFVRVLFSNTVRTPRQSPSPHRSSEARWTASAGKSPEALDRSGFTQDGIGVQILQRTESTAGGFARDLGTRDDQFSDIDHDQFRSALLALSSGVPIEDLKFRVSARLFDLIKANIDKLRANIEALR